MKPSFILALYSLALAGIFFLGLGLGATLGPSATEPTPTRPATTHSSSETHS